MASEAVGGLYVAVGINAKPAIDQAEILQDRLRKLSKEITAAGTNANLDALVKKMERLAAATERVNQAFPKSVPKTPTGSQQPTDPVDPKRQVQIDAEVLASRLRLNQDFVQRIVQLEASKNLSIEQQMRLSAAREQAINLQKALQEQRLDEATYNKKMALLRQEVAQVENAARQQLKAQQDAARALQQQTGLGGVFGAGAQELFVGLGAARSGNYFYGLAAFARYFKNVSSSLSSFRAESVSTQSGIDGVGVAAAGAAPRIAALKPVAVGATGAFVALSAAVAAVGVGLAAVGAKIAVEGLKQASNLEMLKIQYEGLLGSAAAAQAEVNSVLTLGTQSIVPTEQLLDANRLLLSFGVTATEQRRQLLEFISAFSSVTGASLTQVQNLSYALGQIVAAGKANSIDLRQLANAGISTTQIFEAIAQQQGISVAEARALNEEGKLYADIIIPAILSRTESLAGAQEKARNSAYGIYVNLKDIAKIKLGEAFSGLLESLKPILKWVEDFVKAFDFRYIATAFGNVVKYFRQGFKSLNVDAGTTSKGIAETIGKAVNVIGYVAVKIAQNVVAVFNTVMVAINFVWAAIQGAVGIILFAVSEITKVAAKVPGPWQESMQSIADSSLAASVAASNGAQIAGKAWQDGATAAMNAWENFYLNWPKFEEVTIPDLPPVVEPPPFEPPPFVPPSDLGGGDKKDPALERAKAFIELAKELIGKAREASKSLAESLTLPFAEAIKAGGAQVKTAAEEAFSSMDINTIVTQFSDLRDAIKDYYAPLENVELSGSKKISQQAKAQRKQIISELRDQAYELVRLASENQRLAQELEKAQTELDAVSERLAKRREQLTTQYNAQKKKINRQFDDYYTATSATEGALVRGALSNANAALDAAKAAYEAAADKLKQLQEARDSFLQGVKDSLRSFVNNIAGVAKEIETYTRLDDIGSFMMTKSSANDLASFRQSLQERLDALKQWRAQVQQLMSRGLNSDFLQSLVQQGPEATKDVVAALAGASDAELADINRVQTELAGEISAMQQAASAQWFDAGIAAQEAFTAPLKAAYDAAANQVRMLEEQKALALGVLEAWYSEQNELIDEEQRKAQEDFERIKGDLDAKMQENQKKADQIAKDINKIWGKLPGQAYRTGVATMDGLLQGLKSKEEELKREARRIADAIRQTIASALQINSPSKVMMEMGENVVDGLILGMESAGAALSDTSIQLGGYVPSQRMLPEAPEINVEAPIVKVFIGDQELRDIVDVQIDDASRTERDLAIAGRRF